MKGITLEVNLNDKEDGKRMISILRHKAHPHHVGINQHRSAKRNIKGGLKCFRT